MSVTKCSDEKELQKHILERYLKEGWYEQTLQEQGVTEVTVNEWDRLAEAPKKKTRRGPSRT